MNELQIFNQGDWKIRFLTSGTLTFTNLNGAEGGIDVFLVGGGGAGGNGVWASGYVQPNQRGGGAGAGYTMTKTGVSVTINTPYLKSRRHLVYDHRRTQKRNFGKNRRNESRRCRHAERLDHFGGEAR